MARTPEQEAFDDFDDAVAFPGFSRTDVTFALVEAEGKAVTVAELRDYTDVTPTTIRKTLAKLQEVGLVEETQAGGRRAFRLSPKGRLGYRTWLAERRSADAVAQRRPERTAPLYRWRVRGTASAPGPVEQRHVKKAFADAGVELCFATVPELWVTVEYEVDAADETAALAAATPAGWRMMQMLTRVDRIGLAADLPTREGHELRFAERDPATVAAALSWAVAAKARMLKEHGHLPSSWEDLRQAAATVGEWLSLADMPDDGRLPLPDDAQLIAAISSLWPLLDEAGARAVGASFEVSEQELRERYASHAETAGGPPQGTTWEQLCDEMIETYRRQGRLRA